MMRTGRFLLPALTAGAALALGGCGGGGGGWTATGNLTIAITDAPVDQVSEVWVEFTGISVQGRDGELHEFSLEPPRTIDLRSLTGGDTELLLDGAELPAGAYEWLRLHVNAQFDGILDSRVVRQDGAEFELRVPSGENSGLKLVRGFTVPAGGEAAFVIDWNLRQGLVRPPGLPGYLLQPALRIVDLAEFGTIAGTVDVALLSGPDCSSDPNTGAGNSVYVYAGADVIPDDIDGNDPDPLTTADVRLDAGSGEYRYRVAFLAPGAYTVAFTCQAADDRVPDPENPQEPVDDPIEFTAGQNAVVQNGQTTVVNFP